MTRWWSRTPVLCVQERGQKDVAVSNTSNRRPTSRDDSLVVVFAGVVRASNRRGQKDDVVAVSNTSNKRGQKDVAVSNTSNRRWLLWLVMNIVGSCHSVSQ